MKNRSAPTCAAIDVGSNTIHIVIARCLPDTLEILADEVDMVRIGESVTATGAISPAKCQATLATLQRFRALATQYHVQRTFVVATEAIRQASNRAEFITTVKEHTGLEVQLISGTAEATLTFFGATYEADKHQHLGVIDLGGGSLELTLAHDMQITWTTSLPLGSGWLHDRYLAGDPPTTDEIERAETFLGTYFRKAALKMHAPTAIVTGGSANSLFRLVQAALHRPAKPRRLTLEDLTHCQSLLSTLTSTDIANLYNQPLARARVLLAGTLIIAHMMRQFQLQEILVSQHGIREGVLLAYARYGEDWLRETDTRATPLVESLAQRYDNNESFYA